MIENNELVLDWHRGGEKIRNGLGNAMVIHVTSPIILSPDDKDPWMYASCRVDQVVEVLKIIVIT